MESVFQRLEYLQNRPNQRVVMQQSWRNLLFVHYAYDAEVIQKLLPKGLKVQTFEGYAWVGFVIFQMENVRFVGLPPVPGTASFPETNVRTYVEDKDGTPGVWFFSLDAANPLACSFARASFGLNYIYAEMGMKQQDRSLSAFGIRRQDPSVNYKATWKVDGEYHPAGCETFEFWLIERYILFSLKKGTLFSGQVNHPPYQIGAVHDLKLDQNLTGFISGTAPENLIHLAFSPGVDVEVFGLKRLPI